MSGGASGAPRVRVFVDHIAHDLRSRGLPR
jgi:hypothetical protein